MAIALRCWTPNVAAPARPAALGTSSPHQHHRTPPTLPHPHNIYRLGHCALIDHPVDRSVDRSSGRWEAHTPCPPTGNSVDTAMQDVDSARVYYEGWLAKRSGGAKNGEMSLVSRGSVFSLPVLGLSAAFSWPFHRLSPACPLPLPTFSPRFLNLLTAFPHPSHRLSSGFSRHRSSAFSPPFIDPLTAFPRPSHRLSLWHCRASCGRTGTTAGSC